MVFQYIGMILIVTFNMVLGMLSVGKALGSDAGIHFFDQGFDEETRQTFYHATQGTRLLPYSWFLVLEQATNSHKFLEDENLRRLGFIPDHNSLHNPDHLPVGFAKTIDLMAQDTWVGLTCAACHTLGISYKEHTMSIDGGPAMVDALTLMQELEKAIQALLVGELDEGKFERFAKSVLKEQHNEIGEQRLREQVRTYYESLQRPQEIAKEFKFELYPNQWGKGRLDALGRGGNTVLLQLDRGNLRPANAPVSFPAIWNTWFLNWVQWNGAAMQPMGRNLLQALGLNANLTVEPNNNSFKTSTSIKDLAGIEKLVQRLQPPDWPVKIFGKPIDQASASQGGKLYEQHCAHCHVPKLTEPNAHGDQFKKVHLIPLQEIGTDPLSATNFHNRMVKSGPLGLGLLTVADTAQYLTTKIMEGQFKELNLTHEQQKAWTGDRANTMRAPLGYMARPHSGVWALAPYLHNGSIPNLYQLLSPQNERDDVFYVGHSEFDPIHVGFITQKKMDADFKFDTALPGNSNAGHEFRDGPRQNGVIGPALSEAERWDLIEYLKTI